MKKRYIPLVAFGSLIGAILVVFAFDAALNTCHMRSENSDINERWMGNIKDDTKLNNIAIPGSHDAGTEGMIFLGETQHRTITEQLNDGIRYFDVRIRKTDKDEHIIYHSIVNGKKAGPILDEFVAFSRTHPTETLILDFQHFDNGAEDFVCSFVDEHQSLFVKKTAGQSDLEFIDNLTMGEARGKMIAIFGNGKDQKFGRDYIFNRNNDSCSKEGCALDSYYDDDYKKSSEHLIKNVLPANYERIETKIQKEGHKGLFVLQSQLTDGALIFGPYSKEKTHSDNMSNYVKNIKDDPRRLNLTNIIMRDFLDVTKASEIISLNNFKGIVKEGLI